MTDPKTMELPRESPGSEPMLSSSNICPDKIRETAYSKWEAAGCPSGDGVKFWLEAEAELVNNPQSCR